MSMSTLAENQNQNMHAQGGSTVYVIPAQYQQAVDTSANERDREIIPTTCAAVGLAFSWIPFVGCMNFLLNLGAPEGSARALLGLLSCVIASIVFLFLVICLPVRYVYYDDHEDDMM